MVEEGRDPYRQSERVVLVVGKVEGDTPSPSFHFRPLLVRQPFRLTIIRRPFDRTNGNNSRGKTRIHPNAVVQHRPTNVILPLFDKGVTIPPPCPHNPRPLLRHGTTCRSSLSPVPTTMKSGFGKPGVAYVRERSLVLASQE
jgi:hypothetical protein